MRIRNGAGWPRLFFSSLFFLSLLFGSSTLAADRDRDGYNYQVDCRIHENCDCNDADRLANSAAAEICNGYDDDCSRLIDDDPACDGYLTNEEKIGGETLLDDGAGDPSVVWGDGHYAVAYGAENQILGYTAQFALFDTQGRLILQKPLDPDPQDNHRNPDLAWSGNEYGVVWQDMEGITHVDFALLDRHGNLQKTGLRLSSDELVGQDPQIAWGGEKFGVVWHEDDWATGFSGVFFTTVSATGVAEPARQLSLTQIGVVKNLALEWNGNHFAVAVGRSDGTLANYYFVLLDAQGNLVSETVVDEGGEYWDFALELEWLGDEYGFFWDRCISGLECDITLTRLLESGDFLNPTDPHVNVSGDLPHLFDPPRLNSIAWNGDEYGMILRYVVSFPTDPTIRYHFSRVSREGVRQGSLVRIAPDSIDNMNDSLAWSGYDFGITWEDWTTPAGLYYTHVGYDADGDGRVEGRDCDDADNSVWGAPTAAAGLYLGSDKETLTWNAPRDAGGTSPPLYDVLRSPDPADFSAADCIESDDSDTTANDPAQPAPDGAYFYLIRAESACGSNMGKGGDGSARSGGSCP